MVIFNALDFGLKEDEERQLSPALENMIDLMTSAGKTVAGYFPKKVFYSVTSIA